MDNGGRLHRRPDVPECTNGLDLKKSDQPAGFGVMRHVKQIAWRPLEFDGEASPLVEEQASVIDGAFLCGLTNPCRHAGPDNNQIKLLCHV
jgi:hypothetical protein